MAHLTAEESKLQYQFKMGEELGSVFWALICDIAHLFEKWGDYERLSGTDRETVELLNNSAPGFFGRYQSILERDVIQHLARLVDREKSLGRTNLSIKKLVSMVDDPQLSQVLCGLVQKMEQETNFVTSWRNLVLAHHDLDFAVDKSGARQPVPVSRVQKKAAMNSICAVMNAICAHYCDSTIGFEYTYSGDAEALLFVLREANKRQQKCLAC